MASKRFSIDEISYMKNKKIIIHAALFQLNACLNQINYLYLLRKFSPSHLTILLSCETIKMKYHGKGRIKDNRTHLHPIRTAGESFFLDR